MSASAQKRALKTANEKRREAEAFADELAGLLWDALERERRLRLALIRDGGRRARESLRLVYGRRIPPA